MKFDPNFIMLPKLLKLGRDQQHGSWLETGSALEIVSCSKLGWGKRTQGNGLNQNCQGSAMTVCVFAELGWLPKHNLTAGPTLNHIGL